MWGSSKALDSKFGHWWVDDEGAWNFWGLDRSNDSDSRGMTEPAFRRLALHRLGMVQVSFRPASTLVEFDLQRVHDAALEGTVDFFVTADFSNRVELRFFHQAWNIERHCCAAAVVRRIAEVRSFRDAANRPRTGSTAAAPESSPCSPSPPA